MSSNLLGEFLQEQQEPFALEVYLVERGYRGGIKKRQYVVPNCSGFLRAVFSQFVVAPKLNDSANGGRRNGLNLKSRQENATDQDRCSSASYSTTFFNSCSESDVGETDMIRGLAKCGNLFSEVEAAADRKKKGRADEDSKQLSPISVLDETGPDEDSSIHYKQAGESSNSVSQCKLIKKSMHYSFHRLKELMGSNNFDQYNINRRALQQRKQLLIDCVREVIEKLQKRVRNREEIKKMLGAEELWKLVCENVWIWSQDSVNGSNILHLLHYDFLASKDEWNSDFEQHKMEISSEVENAILDDVINEIVTFIIW